MRSWALCGISIRQTSRQGARGEEQGAKSKDKIGNLHFVYHKQSPAKICDHLARYYKSSKKILQTDSCNDLSAIIEVSNIWHSSKTGHSGSWMISSHNSLV